MFRNTKQTLIKKRKIFKKNKCDFVLMHCVSTYPCEEKDLNLNSQIDLNLASSYFKRNEFDLSKNILSRIKVEYFEDSEKEKYYKYRTNIFYEIKRL